MEFKIYVQIFKHVLSWKKIDFNRMEYERGIREILAPKDLAATIFDWWDSNGKPRWKTSNSWDRTFDSTILMFATAKGSKLDNSDYPKHEDIDVNDIQTWIILEYQKTLYKSRNEISNFNNNKKYFKVISFLNRTSSYF